MSAIIIYGCVAVIVAAFFGYFLVKLCQCNRYTQLIDPHVYHSKYVPQVPKMKYNERDDFCFDEEKLVDDENILSPKSAYQSYMNGIKQSKKEQKKLKNSFDFTQKFRNTPFKEYQTEMKDRSQSGEFNYMIVGRERSLSKNSLSHYYPHV
jgi:hypothetical protein